MDTGTGLELGLVLVIPIPDPLLQSWDSGLRNL